MLTREFQARGPGARNHTGPRDPIGCLSSHLAVRWRASLALTSGTSLGGGMGRSALQNVRHE